LKSCIFVEIAVFRKKYLLTAQTNEPRAQAKDNRSVALKCPSFTLGRPVELLLSNIKTKGNGAHWGD